MSRRSLIAGLKRSPFLWMFALSLLITFIRGWDRLQHPGIWAEDGPVLFMGALKGVSVFSPSDGYIQFLPRLLFKSAVLLPFVWIAPLVCAVCYVIFAAIAALFIDPAYEWLVPPRPMRVVFCVLFCFAPGLNEMLGNAANLYSMLCFSLALLGLRNIDSPLGWLGSLWGFIVCASSGATVLLLPLFSWRLLAQYRAGVKIKKLLPALVVLASIIIFTALNFLASKTISTRTVFEWHEVYRKYQYIFSMHFVAAPILGPYFTTQLFASRRHLVFRLSLAVFVLALWILRGLQKRRTLQLALFELGIFLLPLLIFIVRPDSMRVFNWRSFSGSWFWGNRYAFQVFMAGLVLWVAVIARIKSPRLPCLNVCLIGLLAFANLYMTQFWINRYGDRDWPADAHTIEDAYQTGPVENVHIPIYP